MCIAAPMQVVAAHGTRARVRGRDGEREVDVSLVQPVVAGEWLMVFLDAARERVPASHAEEVNRLLDWMGAAAQGRAPSAQADPGFDLPSAQSAEALGALLGPKPSAC